jgi:lysozyme
LTDKQRASPRLHAYIKGKEKLRLKAYLCPAGVWTCGMGTTRGVKEGDVWTEQRAQLEFERDIAEAEALVHHYVKHAMTQGQFDAFVSIFQNVGPGSKDKSGIGRLKDGSPSTLLRKFNDGDIGGAENEWPKWCSPGTDYEGGLRKRRYEELAMFRGEGY